MSKPNFLIFMSDQQRSDTVPPYKRAFTPNLDRFYEKAVSFTNAHCPSPHCCPSRASFYSGLYPSEHGVWNNVNVPNALSKGLNDGIRLWSQDLKDNGYNMFFSGKWHVSNEEGPSNYGFDEEYPKINYKELGSKSEWRYYETDEYENLLNPIGRELNGKRYAGQLLRDGYPGCLLYGINENPFGDEDVIDNSISMLNKAISQDEPFCLFTGTLGPHDPYLVPQRFIKMYENYEIELPQSFNDEMKDKPALYRRTRDRFKQLSDEEYKEAMRYYLAFCTYEDYLFGRLFDELCKNDKLKDTIVIYLSDHGDYVGEHGLFTKGLPCFESVYKIPLLIGGYNISGGRICDEFVNTTDIAPTILELTNIKTDVKHSGKSILPLIKNECSEIHSAVYTQTNGNELYGIQRSVRTKKYKLVYNGFDYDELYDLENDKNEMCNLSQIEEYREIRKELYKMLWQFAKEHNDKIINPYIMVSLAEFGPGIIDDKFI